MAAPDAGRKRGRGLRLLGHPVHAALSDFPLALLCMSVVADAIGWLSGSALLWVASFWVVVVGLGAAVPTACAGLIDYSAIEDEHVARTGTIHMLVMLTAVCCFGIDLLVRGGASPPQGAARVAAFALDVSGAILLVVGGWYGGELVFAHGVGRATMPN